MRSVDKDSELEQAIEDFMAAGRKYREFLKRNHPDRLNAILWATDESTAESVCYSTSERYRMDLCNLFWDRFKDEFSFERKEDPEEEV